MRKNLYIVAVAAMTILASCQKDDSYVEPEELVFTASIATSDTKTTINADNTDSENKGKIYWVAGDEITITDNNSNTAVYTAQNGGSTTTTFTVKEAQEGFGVSPYTATYGTAPSTSQSYSDYYSDEKEAKNLYMTAPSTSSKNFTFTAACGLMKINLTSSDASDKTISKIEVFGTPTDGSFTAYTLTCSTAKDISKAKDFFIALPAGNYTVLKFTNSTGHICYKTAKNEIEITNNTIQPVTLTGIVFDDMLPGKFTVASGKQVKFSKGNLQAYIDASGAPTSWCFATNQYDYIGNAVANTSIGSTAGYVDLFGWSTSTTTYGINTSTSPGTYTGNFVDWGNVMGSSSSWFTLSNDEWSYLINSTSLCKYGVTVAGNSNCLIIAPDGYSGTIEDSYSADEWSTAEAQGLVCLPTAGCRNGSSVSDAGSNGYYWSSTPKTWNTAYYLSFNSSAVYPDSSRRYGRSVRLVRK